MSREVETTYGCFRCGVLTPALRRDVHDRVLCGECGERGVVTFKQALDMLNNVWIYDRRAIEELTDIDEYYIEEKEQDGAGN